MVSARYKCVPNIKSIGCFGLTPLVAFTSDESHYSIQKAVHWLGIGTDNLIIVKTNQDGCMSVESLVENIEQVIKSNRQPFFVNATAGTTVLGAFDDLNTIADVCEKYNMWMHVDVSIVVQLVYCSCIGFQPFCFQFFRAALVEALCSHEHINIY